MNNIFTVHSDLKLGEDAVLKTIKEVSAQDLDFPSGLVFVKLDGSNNDFESVRTELQSGMQSWGILSDLILSMQKEISSLVQLFEEFYHAKSDYKTYSNEGLSPMEINFLINTALLRIRRMQNVINPNYTKTDFQDKKTKNSYTMIKGYILNDEGKKKRSLSRNIINTEASLADLTAKIIKAHVKNSVVVEQDKSMGFRPDLIVSDDENRWAVEIKLTAKDSLIRTFVMLEMWKLYKQTYTLIN